MGNAQTQEMPAHPPPSAEDQRQHEALTCALCLHIFQEPMLLPCSHTFCLRCLKKLVDKATDDAPQDSNAQKLSSPSSVKSKDFNHSKTDRKSFPCPTCRSSVAIPEDMVAAFHLNASIDPKDIFKAIDHSHCIEHPGKIMTMFCIKCDVIICKKCKIDHHTHHKSQDIENTAASAEVQLSKETLRIQDLHNNLVLNVKKREQDLKEFEAKKAVVEREIVERYNRIIAAAQKHRDEALAVLQTCDNDEGHRLKKGLDVARLNLREAQYLYQRITLAKTAGDPCTIVTVSKEMMSGSGSEAAVKKLVEVDPLTQACCPEYRSELPDVDAMFQAVKMFIGTCEVVTQPPVKEKEPGLLSKPKPQSDKD